MTAHGGGSHQACDVEEFDRDEVEPSGRLRNSSRAPHFAVPCGPTTQQASATSSPPATCILTKSSTSAPTYLCATEVLLISFLSQPLRPRHTIFDPDPHSLYRQRPRLVSYRSSILRQTALRGPSAHKEASDSLSSILVDFPHLPVQLHRRNFVIVIALPVVTVIPCCALL